MTLTIRLADQADLPTVHAIIHTAARRLHSRGYDQWPNSSPNLGHTKLGEQIQRGETYLVTDDRDPVATIAVSRDGDPDFWTPSERADKAIYISKTAVVREGTGVGALMMRWVIDRAAAHGDHWARLDAWRTNRELHAYYQRQGWNYVRTVDLSHRRSGVLFQRPVTADAEARKALAWEEQPDWNNMPGKITRPYLQIGSPVIVSTPEGPVAANITDVIRDWGLGITEQGWEHGAAGPSTRYEVTRDGRTWTPSTGQIWADRLAMLNSPPAK